VLGAGLARRWRDVIRPTPLLDLLLAELHHGLLLILALQRSIVALVEAVVLDHRRALRRLFKHDAACLLRSLEHGRERNVEVEVRLLDFDASSCRLLDTEMAQIDIDPAREEVEFVPR